MQLINSPLTWSNQHVEITIPFSTPGISTLVIINSKKDKAYHLCDIGDGSLKYLCENYNFKETLFSLSSVLLTHDHFDHIGSIISILGYLRMEERKTPLTIVIPQGASFIRQIVDLYVKRVKNIPFELNLIEIGTKETIDINNWQISAYQTVHWGSIQLKGIDTPIEDGTASRCYVLSYGNTKIGISGDTGDAPILKQIAPELDCFVLESTYHQDFNGDPILLEKVHLSYEKATEIGQLSKDYLLYHPLRR